MRNQILSIAVVLSCVCSFVVADEGQDERPLEQLLQLGETIYLKSCAECHGVGGQGVETSYEDPLVGDDSVGQLATAISETMPEGEPELCVESDAEAVAAYIHYSFYSKAAQIRNRPPRIGLARLTASQLRQSLSDLYTIFDSAAEVSDQAGVTGKYYDGDRRRNENLEIERVDPMIDFDWGHDGPGGEIKPESFAINWDGGIRVDESGRYEIVVHSTCSFVFYFGRDGKELINNHVQSGDKTEFRRTIALTGGRVYPFEIEFRQRKRKTELPPAKFSLRWVPPGGVEETVPVENLVHGRIPPAFALQAVLPPDDRSYGFERGIAINREWDESTTAVAIEFAEVAFEELWPSFRSRNRRESNENRQLLKRFLSEIVAVAFRGRLDDVLRKNFIDRHVDIEQDDREAIKRVLLLALKSPRFLYPTLDAHSSPSQRAANRLTLVLYDSLANDQELENLIERGEFTSEAAIRKYVEEHIGDFRVRAKTRTFLNEWMNLSDAAEITKNQEHFPQFNKELLNDMKRSLAKFLDAVVWEGSSDFREFFIADWSYSTQRMGEFLGDPWKRPAEGSGTRNDLFKTGEFGKEHFGLVTHPYLLSRLAYHDSTSPIHRGVFLIRHVLGRTLRPPNEAFTPLSPDLHPDLTTRERIELQTSPESCQVCHSKINGLGYSLENFDAAGRFRDVEKKKPIDSTGSYTTRAGKEVTFTGPRELAEFLVDSDDVHDAFVSKAFQHFVKQPPAAYAPDQLERLTEKFRESDFNIRKLIVEIAVVAATQAASPTQQELAASN